MNIDRGHKYNTTQEIFKTIKHRYGINIYYEFNIFKKILIVYKLIILYIYVYNLYAIIFIHYLDYFIRLLIFF